MSKMSKKHDTPALESGLAALGEAGIDQELLAAGSPSADQLAAILSSGTEASLALAHLLGTIPRQDHADLLAAADPATHGALRREVRRALYRLRQAGLEPAQQSPGPTPPAAALGREEPEAWFSHVDGRGDQLVWITQVGLGGLLFVSARINDQEGMCEISGVEISKRQFRAQRDQLADRHRLRMVPVPWRHADALLDAAQARGSQKGRQSYSTIRAQFTTEPPVALEPPIYQHIARDAVESTLVAVSGELLKEPEFQSWLPHPTVVEPYVEEIMGARESRLVLSQPQQEDRLSNILDRATGELYPAAVWASRLETMAFYLYATGRVDPAQVATAVAQALGGGAPAQAVPVLAALAREALSAGYEIAQATIKEEERGSVLVKPGASATHPATRK
jgi:hypothetical protein